MFTMRYSKIWAVLLAAALASTTLSAGLAGCSSSTLAPLPTATPTPMPIPILASILPMVVSGSEEGAASQIYTWTPPTLEQAIVEQQTSALPEEIAQIGYDQIIPNGLARIGIESAVVNFSDNGLVGDAYHWAPLVIDSKGGVIWAYDPTIGQLEWPVELDFVFDAEGKPVYSLHTQGLEYKTIPDSKGAVIVWSGVKDGEYGKYLSILAKDPVTLPDGRQVYSLYWDRSAQEWLPTPGLAEATAVVSPTEVAIVIDQTKFTQDTTKMPEERVSTYLTAASKEITTKWGEQLAAVYSPLFDRIVYVDSNNQIEMIYNDFLETLPQGPIYFFARDGIGVFTSTPAETKFTAFNGPHSEDPRADVVLLDWTRAALANYMWWQKEEPIPESAWREGYFTTGSGKDLFDPNIAQGKNQINFDGSIVRLDGPIFIVPQKGLDYSQCLIYSIGSASVFSCRAGVDKPPQVIVMFLVILLVFYQRKQC